MEGVNSLFVSSGRCLLLEARGQGENCCPNGQIPVRSPGKGQKVALGTQGGGQPAETRTWDELAEKSSTNPALSREKQPSTIHPLIWEHLSLGQDPQEALQLLPTLLSFPVAVLQGFVDQGESIMK